MNSRCGKYSFDIVTENDGAALADVDDREDDVEGADWLPA